MEKKSKKKGKICVYIYIYVCIHTYVYITESLCYTSKTNSSIVNQLHCD